MKRRFRYGVPLVDSDFHAQEWTRGMLQLHEGALWLSESGPGHIQPPAGMLYKPTIRAVYADTISFSGAEREGRQWVVQVWYCEIGHGGELRK